MKNMKDPLYEEFYDPTEDLHLEPRVFCYELATELLNRAKQKAGENWYNDLSTIKGILLLLFTWNFAGGNERSRNVPGTLNKSGLAVRKSDCVC